MKSKLPLKEAHAIKASIALLLIMFSLSAYAGPTYRITKRGSKDGIHYNYVYEAEIGDTYILTCLNRGNISCPLIGTIGTDWGPGIIQLELFVISNIIDGMLSETGNMFGLWYSYVGEYNSDTNEWSYDMYVAQEYSDLYRNGN
jgi:hypothetical protein